MGEPMQIEDASLQVRTHPDAEIFLMANDRRVIASEVGELKQRLPKGIYRIKVSRATATHDQLFELDSDLVMDVTVEGLDTVVPFERTLPPGSSDDLKKLASNFFADDLLCISRSPFDATASSRYRFAVIPKLDANIPRFGVANIRGETWTIAGWRTSPGTHILSTVEGRTTQNQALLVLSGWQTRLFSRFSPALEGQRPGLIRDVSVHVAPHGAPLPLPQEYEPSEIVRWALAMERDIVRPGKIIDIFLDEKFFDPIAGLAGAHIMLDAIDRISERARSEGRPPPENSASSYEIDQVLGNLANLLQMPGNMSPDLVALYARAGRLLDVDTIVSQPPIYHRSWEHLLKASKGENPKIRLSPALFAECAANYSSGPYLAWTPFTVASYVEHVFSAGLPPPISQSSVPSAVSRPERPSAERIQATTTRFFSRRLGIPEAQLRLDRDLRSEFPDEVWHGVMTEFGRTATARRLGIDPSQQSFASVRSLRDLLAITLARSDDASYLAPPETFRRTKRSATRTAALARDQAYRAQIADELGLPRNVLDSMFTGDQAISDLTFRSGVVWTDSDETPAFLERATEIIIEYTVKDADTYADRYARPHWPGGDRGITIGIGYDLGRASLEEFQDDWRDKLPPPMLHAIASVLGIRGGEAAALDLQALAHVYIPWLDALDVHEGRVLPRVIDKIREALPNSQIIGDCIGALVSLCHDRGVCFAAKGPEFREFRAIRRAMTLLRFSEVPKQIRRMKRLEAPHSIFQWRREAEAKFFEAGLSGN